MAAMHLLQIKSHCIQRILWILRFCLELLLWPCIYVQKPGLLQQKEPSHLGPIYELKSTHREPRRRSGNFAKQLSHIFVKKLIVHFLPGTQILHLYLFLLQHGCKLVVFFHHLHTYEIERISSNNNLIKLSIGRKGRSPEKKMFTYAPELGGSCFFLPLILHQPAFYTKFTIVVYFYFKMAFHYRNQI